MADKAVKIRITSVLYSMLETKDKKLLKELRRLYTFEPEGAQFTRRALVLRAKSKAAQGMAWGIPLGTSFISPGGRFPTGLLTEIASTLRENNIEFEKVDERTKEHQNPPKITPVTETSLPNVTLRDYQVEAANIALTERRGIVKCATGGGKTVIFASMVNAFNNNYSTAILMRNRTLVEQTFNAFKQFGIKNVGRIMGDIYEPSLINIGTVQSLHRFPAVEKTKALIVDEVHEFTSKKSAKQLREFKNTIFRFGFSATPWKEDDPIHDYTLKSWIGPALVDVDVSDLYLLSLIPLEQQGVLSQAICRFYTVPEPVLSNSLSWPEAEDLGISGNPYFHKLVADMVNSIPEGRIMIMVRKLRHGDMLNELIPGSFWIRGEDSVETREFVLNKLRKSDQKKVVAIVSSIGYVGVNVFVHHLINASGGKSAIELIQKFGRGLRVAQDKSLLTYHDFVFTGHKWLKEHSLQRQEILQSQGHHIETVEL